MAGSKKGMPPGNLKPGKSPLKSQSKKSGSNKATKPGSMRSAPSGTPLKPNC